MFGVKMGAIVFSKEDIVMLTKMQARPELQEQLNKLAKILTRACLIGDKNSLGYKNALTVLQATICLLLAEKQCKTGPYIPNLDANYKAADYKTEADLPVTEITPSWGLSACSMLTGGILCLGLGYATKEEDFGQAFSAVGLGLLGLCAIMLTVAVWCAYQNYALKKTVNEISDKVAAFRCMPMMKVSDLAIHPVTLAVNHSVQPAGKLLDFYNWLCCKPERRGYRRLEEGLQADKTHKPGGRGKP